MRIQHHLSIILFVAVVGAIGLAAAVGVLMGGVEEAAHVYGRAVDHQRQVNLLVEAGQVLMEDIRYDESGQLLTGSFMDYCMPRADDLSFMAVESNPVPTKTNPLGVKGAGEAGNVGALPAVANALVDALSVYGIRHIGMPATPERIWRAIRDAKAAGA